MPLRLLSRVLLLLLASLTVHAQVPELSKAVQELVRVNAGKVVLSHVRIIDGTGAPAVEDQNVMIEGGKVTAIQPGADVQVDVLRHKPSARSGLDLHTVTSRRTGLNRRHRERCGYRARGCE